MLPNFEKTYRSLPVVELLKIIGQPEKYQPEAIKTAQKVLRERTITEKDNEAVYDYFFQQQQKENKAKEITDRINKKADDLLHPILHPSEDASPSNWLNILLIYVTIYDGGYFLKQIFAYAQMYKMWGADQFINAYFFIGLIQLLLIPLYIFLLWKYEKWGWILLVAVKTFIVVSIILSLPSFLSILKNLPGFSVFQQLFSFTSASAVLVFMLNSQIMEKFSVTPKIKLNTVAISIVVYFILTFILGLTD